MTDCVKVGKIDFRKLCFNFYYSMFGFFIIIKLESVGYGILMMDIGMGQSVVCDHFVSEMVSTDLDFYEPEPPFMHVTDWC